MKNPVQKAGFFIQLCPDGPPCPWFRSQPTEIPQSELLQLAITDAKSDDIEARDGLQPVC
jgi:hypothetical protein